MQLSINPPHQNQGLVSKLRLSMKDLTKPTLLVTTHVKRNLATNIAEAFKNYNIRLVSKQADSQVGLH